MSTKTHIPTPAAVLLVACLVTGYAAPAASEPQQVATNAPTSEVSDGGAIEVVGGMIRHEPLFSPDTLRRLTAAEVRRQAFGGQYANAGGTQSSGHACGWGLALLAGGVLWDVAVVANPNSYKDPNVRGWNAPLKGSAAVGLSLGLGLAILGGYRAATHCGARGTAQGQGQAVPAAAPMVQPPTIPTYAVQSSAAQDAIDQIRQGPHGQVPPVQATGGCSGSNSVLSIENGTLYTLSLYLSGMESRTLALNPGQTVNLRVQSGRYDVGARVSAPNVYPFAGEWNLARGCPYGSLFYIQ